MTSRRCRRWRTRRPSPSRTPASRSGCASSPSSPSASGSPARCTTGSPRSWATSTRSRRPSRAPRDRAGRRGPRTQLAELAAAARSVYVDVREAILGLRSPIRPEAGLVGRHRGVRRPLRRGVEAGRRGRGRAGGPRGAAARAGGRGPGLPDRPGGADERPQARRRASGGRAVGVEVEDAAFVMTVADDGRGFVAAEAGLPGDWPHYGLRRDARARAASSARRSSGRRSARRRRHGRARRRAARRSAGGDAVAASVGALPAGWADPRCGSCSPTTMPCSGTASPRSSAPGATTWSAWPATARRPWRSSSGSARTSS